MAQWVSARMSAGITLAGSDHRSSTFRGQLELHGANKMQNERWGERTAIIAGVNNCKWMERQRHDCSHLNISFFYILHIRHM